MTEISKKEPLLFLCHRIPFPPNKGDKIRSFNILKKLNDHFDIHLGYFVDDPFDLQYTDKLAEYCVSQFFLEQKKLIAKLKGLTSFLTAKPITLPYYYDAKMQRWVNKVTEKYDIQRVFVFSSSMAQYCQTAKFKQALKVIDFVDVDSDKWRQYAQKSSGINKWIYQREYKYLANYEDFICQYFDYSLFVSPQEAALFADRQDKSQQGKVIGLLNGVDLDFFDRSKKFEIEPIPTDESFISFTGAMDYWANVEAVEWFVSNIWPTIKSTHPNLKFYVVGGNPNKDILALNNQNGVVVTGRVNDVRPYIEQAKCVVAPMRIARGIQNKVLEAMALSKAVVMTSLAAEGISLPEDQGKHVSDDAVIFAEHVNKLLNDLDLCIKIGGENRCWMDANFRWDDVLMPLPILLQS
jgi:sugar transferase (PEP-CTERM/EpsH1 system associated)